MAENNNNTVINATNDIINQYQLESLNLQNSNIGKDINERFESINKNFAKLVGSEYLKGAKGDSIITKKIKLSKNKSPNNGDGYNYYLKMVDLITSSLSDTDKLSLFLGAESTELLDENNRFKDLTDIEINKDIVGDRFDGLDQAEFTLIYEVIDDVQSNEILTCLPFTFKDPWFGKITKNIDNENNIGINIDLSCIICYDIINYDSNNNSPVKDFIRTSLAPSIYYSADDKRFNWVINGVETGLSAEGPQGKDGEKGTGVLLAEYIVKDSNNIITRFHYHLDNAEEDWVEVYEPNSNTQKTVPDELKYNLVNNCVVFAVLNEQQDQSISPQDADYEYQNNTKNWIWGLLHVDNSPENYSGIYKIREGGKLSDIIGVSTHTLLSLMTRNRYNFIPYQDSYNVAEKTADVSRYDGHVLYSSANISDMQGSGEEATTVKIRPSEYNDVSVLNIGPSNNDNQPHPILNSEYEDNFFNKISIGTDKSDSDKYIKLNTTITKDGESYGSYFPHPVAGIMQYAKRLVDSAGSSGRPIYFSDGKPAPCDDILDVDIYGCAATAAALSLKNVGDDSTPVYFKNGVPVAIEKIDVPATTSLYTDKLAEIEYESKSDSEIVIKNYNPINRGNSNIPVYFDDGKPVVCSDILNVSITGNSNSSIYSTKLATISDNPSNSVSNLVAAGLPNSPVYFKDGVPVQCDNTLNVSITDNAGSADKLNTDAGSPNSPVYFENGVPVQCSGVLSLSIDGNAGSADKLNVDAGSPNTPVYFKDGVPVEITTIAGNAGSADKLNTDAGSSNHPIYFSDGKPVQCDSTLNVSITGNAETATSARNAETATELSSNAGSSGRPIYFSGGRPVQCDSTLNVSITGNAETATGATRLISKTKQTTSVGDDSHPVYFENGVPKICTNLKDAFGDTIATATKLSSNAGSSNRPIYFSDGKPVQCDSTLKVNITGNAETATKLSSNAGSSNRPIYFSDGKPVQCDSTLNINISGTAKIAETSNKLKTPRNISTTGGINATCSFDGSSDVNIPITSINENYLTWGNGNKQIAGPIDVAMCNYLNANRLSFMPAKYIKVAYSTDGGNSFIDYGLTDDQKVSLVTTGLGTTLYLGKKSTAQSANNDKLRIEITAENKNLYFSLKKIMMQISTSGAEGCYVTVEKKMYGSSSFNKIDDYSISGWSGWNAITLNSAFGGKTSTTISTIRLTFGFTKYASGYENSTNFRIMKIAMHGENSWVNKNSQLAETGNLYYWDYTGAAYFPSNLNAPVITTDSLICNDIDGDKITAKNINPESSNSVLGKSNLPWDIVYAKNLKGVTNADMANASITNAKITNANIVNATIKNLTGVNFDHVYIQDDFPTSSVKSSSTTTSVSYTVENSSNPWYMINGDVKTAKSRTVSNLSKIKFNTASLTSIQNDRITLTIPDIYIPIGITYMNDFSIYEAPHTDTVNYMMMIKDKMLNPLFDIEESAIQINKLVWSSIEIVDIKATLSYVSNGKTHTIIKQLPNIKTQTYNEYRSDKMHVAIAYPCIKQYSDTIDLQWDHVKGRYEDLEISIALDYSVVRSNSIEYAYATNTKVGCVYTPGIKLTRTQPESHQGPFEALNNNVQAPMLPGRIVLTGNDGIASAAYIRGYYTTSTGNPGIYLTKKGIRIQNGSSYLDFVAPVNNGDWNQSSGGYIEAAIFNTSTGTYSKKKKSLLQLLS